MRFPCLRYEEARGEQQRQEAAHREELEIREAFGEGGLEAWPMFPRKKVWRVTNPDQFDGRVSQEFRVKDEESGERGGEDCARIEASRPTPTLLSCCHPPLPPPPRVEKRYDAPTVAAPVACAVSLLMGRLAGKNVSEVQCILFDMSLMSELEMARWWEANTHRFKRNVWR